MVNIDYSAVVVVPTDLESNHVVIVSIFGSSVLSFVLYFIKINTIVETEVELIKK